MHYNNLLISTETNLIQQSAINLQSSTIASLKRKAETESAVHHEEYVIKHFECSYASTNLSSDDQ